MTRTFEIISRSHRIRDVCRVTGLGRTSIYKLIKEGRLRAVKNGRVTLILDSDLDKFLASLPTAVAPPVGA
jgi:excisionase family DNA binding protein